MERERRAAERERELEGDEREEARREREEAGREREEARKERGAAREARIADEEGREEARREWERAREEAKMAQEERERAEEEREEARREREREKEREERAERERELEGLEREAAEKEREAAKREREAAEREREAAEKARSVGEEGWEDAREEWKGAMEEREMARREREAAEKERELEGEEREAAKAERDAAERERELMGDEREEAKEEREAARAERVAARKEREAAERARGLEGEERGLAEKPQTEGIVGSAWRETEAGATRRCSRRPTMTSRMDCTLATEVGEATRACEWGCRHRDWRTLNRVVARSRRSEIPSSTYKTTLKNFFRLFIPSVLTPFLIFSLLPTAFSQSLTVYPPVPRNAPLSTLESLSPLPPPASLPADERERTLDPHATDWRRRGLPVGVEGVSGFVRWVNGSVGGRECEVRGVGGWNGGGNFSEGMVCEGVAEGEGGEVVGVEVWVEGSGGVERVWAQESIRYDDLREPIVVDVVGKVGSDEVGVDRSANGRFGNSICWIGGDEDGILLVGHSFKDIGYSRAGAVFLIRVDRDGKLSDVTTIASGVNGGPQLGINHYFGQSVAWLGDVDGDGVAWDVAVGAQESAVNPGSVYVMSVKFETSSRVLSRITDNADGGPNLNGDDRFGNSVANLGDVDGDGRAFDIAVGAHLDDTGGEYRGKVYVLSVLPDGRGVVLASISHGNGISGPILANGDYFGYSLSSMWGWEGWEEEEGRVLAIGAHADSAFQSNGGAVHLIHVGSDGKVGVKGKVASGTAGGPFLDPDDRFGASICVIGNADGRLGTVEMIVGSIGDDSKGTDRGAVYVLSFDVSTWEVFWWRKIASDVGGGPALTDGSNFGSSAALLSFVSGYGLHHNIAVGARFADYGTIYLLSFADLTDAASSPSILASHPLPSPSSLSTYTPSIPPSFPPISLPHLDPRATDPSRRVLPLSVLTSSFNASHTLRILNASIDSRPCVSAQLIPDWPISTNTRRIGVACVGVPEGESGKVVGVEVWVEEVWSGEVYGIESSSVAMYDDLAVPMSKVIGKIASEMNGGPTLSDSDEFGHSVSWIGDVDGDGLASDIVVGARFDDSGGINRGAVYVMSLGSDGAAHRVVKIAHETNGGPSLSNYDNFGRSVSWIGDVDGDGVASDIVVGAWADGTGGTERGAVYVLSIGSDGVAHRVVKIAHETNGGPTLSNGVFFGRSVSWIGDVDGDGVVSDIAVGAHEDNTGGTNRGAVYLLSLGSDGVAHRVVKIAHETNGGPSLSDYYRFGNSVSWIGDVDGDGMASDIVVGAPRDDTGGTNRGAVYVMSLDTDGVAHRVVKIAHETNGGPTLSNDDRFGYSISWIGDVDGDGVASDIVVGATEDDTGGTNHGAVYLLCLGFDGTVHCVVKIAHEVNGGPTLSESSNYFGNSVSWIGDVDGDGVASDIVVGARDDTGGSSRGAIFLLSLADLTDTSTPPTIEGAALPTSSLSSISSLIPSYSPTHALPHLNPQFSNLSSILPISLLTNIYQASSNLILDDVSISSTPCNSTSLIPNWPQSTNTRRLGIACIGPPPGISNTIATISITYHSPSSSTTVSASIARYGPCLPLNASLSPLSLPPLPFLSPLGGTPFTIHAPSFTPFNLSSLNASCGAQWTEEGWKEFGAVDLIPEDVDASEVVFGIWVGGRACVERRWMDEETVECVAPAGLGKNLSVVVGVMGRFGVIEGAVSYAEGDLERLGVEEVDVDGEWIAQDGTSNINLTTPLLSHISNPFHLISLHLGPFSASLSPLHPLPFPTPPGGGANHSISLCVIDPHSPLPSNLPGIDTISPSEELCTSTSQPTPTISYIPPSLLSVSPNVNLDVLGGDTLVLDGTNFGDPEALSDSGVMPKVFLGSKECLSVSHISTTRIRCVTPLLTGTTASLKVSILGSSSTEDVTVAIQAVSIVAISPRQVMPAAPGMRKLDFSLSVFGAKEVTRLFIGGEECLRFVVDGDDSIQCSSLPVPPKWQTDFAWLYIANSNQSLSNRSVLRTEPPPSILSINSPNGFPTAGGVSVEVVGMGFGLDEGDFSAVVVGGDENGAWKAFEDDVGGDGVATVNESVVLRRFDSLATLTSSTTISATLPRGVGTNVPIRVITTWHLISPPFYISYGQPSITSITPSTLLPGERNLTLTLCGSNFPPRVQDVQGVWVGGRECGEVRVLGGEECLECVGWSGIGEGEEWGEDGERVWVRGYSTPSTSFLATYVPLPAIESITPQLSQPGDLITINGVGFGVGLEDVGRVWVGGEECVGVVWVSGARLRCIIPTPHPIWTAAKADKNLLVPFVEVVVEMRSGMKSVGLVEGGERLVPGGDVRVRPDPAETPWEVVGWRIVGQSGILVVRWRFPGPALEKERIKERKGIVEEGKVSGFRVEVGVEEFVEGSEGYVRVDVLRDASIEGIADPTISDEANVDAWETHQVTISATTPSPLLVQVRAENSDGTTNWTMAYDPDPREGLLVDGGWRVPESCQQDAYLQTQRLKTADITCALCPVGAVCGGLGAENVTGVQSYWRVPWSKDGLGFALCDVESACLGHSGKLQATILPPLPTSTSTNNSNTSTTFSNSVRATWRALDAVDRSVSFPDLHLIPSKHEGCAEGHRGTLCSACATGYFPGVGGQCTACGNRAWIGGRFFLLILAILFILSLILLRTYRSRHTSSSHEVQVMKIVFTHLQTIAIVGGVQLRWPEAARGFFNAVDSTSSFATSGLAIECVMGSSSSNPFLRTILIILMPLFLIIYMLGFWKVFGFVEERVGWCQRCLRDSERQTIATKPPTITLSSTSPPTPTQSQVTEIPPGSSRWRERVLLGLVVVSFLVQTPVSTAAFRLMTCKPVFAEGDEENYQLRLVMDLDVRCATSENMAAIAAITVPVIILVSLGLPIGMWILLRSIGIKGLRTTMWRQRLGFLINGYRDKHYYWECIVLLRKVFLAFTTTTLAPTGGGMQVTVALLVVLLAISLHARSQPYTSKAINMFEGLALVTGAVTLVCGQLVTLDELGAAGTASNSISIFASVFLIILNTIFFAIALALLSTRIRAIIIRYFPSLTTPSPSPSPSSRSNSIFSSLRRSLSISSPLHNPPQTTTPPTLLPTSHTPTTSSTTINPFLEAAGAGREEEA